MIMFLWAILSLLTIQAVLAADKPKTFVAVVVEGRPSCDRAPFYNLNLYTPALSKTGKFDILVLPEYGLTCIQKANLSDYAIKIDNKTMKEDGFLISLDALARSHSSLIIANILEQDGNKIYSTTFAVNGTGKIIAKYRKIRLSDYETGLSRGSEIVTFKYEPIGSIGLISGDDILYQNPGVDILRKGVTTVVYTTALTSSLPLKLGVSIQQGYAQANGINLLAASLNDPIKGVSGSGIFNNTRSSTTFITGSNQTRVIQYTLSVLDKPNPVSCATVQSSRPATTSLGDVKGLPKLLYNMQGLKTEVISSKNIKAINRTTGSVTCTFNATATIKTDEYFSIAYSEKACLVVRCDDKSKNCGNVTGTPSTTVFDKIEIVISGNNGDFLPYSYNSALQPLSVTFCKTSTAGLNLTAIKPTDVVVMGLVSYEKASGANSVQLVFGLNIFAIILILNYFL